MGHALNGTVQDAAHPPAPHAGPQRALAAGHRPRRHRHADGRRAQLRARARRGRSSGARSSSSASGSGGASTGSTIFEQFKRLGSSMDYRRERFTMDDAYARAVLEVFVAPAREGLHLPRQPPRQLVRRRCRRPSPTSRWSTARSTTSCTRSRYPRRGRRRDRRRHRAAGHHPGRHRRRRAPRRRALARPDRQDGDRAAGRPAACRSSPTTTSKPDFGTGALKITPGHDPIDFEIGRRHGLPTLTAIGFDGRLLDLRPDWEGLGGRREAHERAVTELRESGALRRGDAVPPLRRPLQPLAARASSRSSRCSGSAAWRSWRAPAIDAVRDGRVAFHPKRSEKIYLDWMESIRPGASRGSSGGATACPSGSRPTAATSSQTERPEGDGWEQSDRRARHVVLVGALALRHAGLARATRPSCAPGTRATCCRPRATSSTSGSRA